jgi:hypothetical protein
MDKLWTRRDRSVLLKFLPKTFSVFIHQLHAACDSRNQTFGEMTMEQKAAISHRGRALRLLKEHLLTLV